MSLGGACSVYSMKSPEFLHLESCTWSPHHLFSESQEPWNSRVSFSNSLFKKKNLPEVLTTLHQTPQFHDHQRGGWVPEGLTGPGH